MTDTYADACREQYERTARQVAQGLRDLADRVEKVAVPSDRPSARGSRYTYAAQQVHHELVWGVANLNAYHLIGMAQAADATDPNPNNQEEQQS